jgi:hypothetical protein
MANGLLGLDDFVLHNDADGPRCSLSLTHGVQWTDCACDVGGVALRERLQVPLPMPQESLMWAKLGRCVAAIRAQGARPVAKWAEQSVLTQSVICAIARSLDEGGKPFNLSRFQGARM